MALEGKKEGLRGGWQEGASVLFMVCMSKIPFANIPLAGMTSAPAQAA
jgi:hypothetical protein